MYSLHPRLRSLPTLLVLTLMVLLTAFTAGNAYTQDSSLDYRTPPVPPRPPVQPTATPESAAQPALATLDLPPLKAVLLVGPIDGDYGSWTETEKDNMDLVATELEANGVSVYKFYTPDNDWTQIKQAAEGAHFLFYRGHGFYDGTMPYPVWVGGFGLKDRFVSSDDIRNELHLAPNAIVMLYGCFAAGTAGNDQGSISSDEAQRRVAMYSDPFMDIGVAGYYANWFGDAFKVFVHNLYEGKTLQEAYETYFDFNADTVERYTHPDHADKVMWLDKDVWDGKTQYNNAFVGLPEETLESLFGGDPPAELPAVPTDLDVSSVTQTSITLGWVDASDNEQGFSVYRWNGLDWEQVSTLSADSTTWTDTAVTCGTGYAYRVAAFNSVGESINDSGIDGRTDVCTTNETASITIFLPVVQRYSYEPYPAPSTH